MSNMETKMKKRLRQRKTQPQNGFLKSAIKLGVSAPLKRHFVPPVRFKIFPNHEMKNLIFSLFDLPNSS